MAFCSGSKPNHGMLQSWKELPKGALREGFPPQQPNERRPGGGGNGRFSGWGAPRCFQLNAKGSNYKGITDSKKTIQAGLTLAMTGTQQGVSYLEADQQVTLSDVLQKLGFGSWTAGVELLAITQSSRLWVNQLNSQISVKSFEPWHLGRFGLRC